LTVLLLRFRAAGDFAFRRSSSLNGCGQDAGAASDSTCTPPAALHPSQPLHRVDSDRIQLRKIDDKAVIDTAKPTAVVAAAADSDAQVATGSKPHSGDNICLVTAVHNRRNGATGSFLFLGPLQALLGLGLVLIAIGLYRARTFPRWQPILLGLAAPALAANHIVGATVLLLALGSMSWRILVTPGANNTSLSNPGVVEQADAVYRGA